MYATVYLLIFRKHKMTIVIYSYCSFFYKIITKTHLLDFSTFIIILHLLNLYIFVYIILITYTLYIYICIHACLYLQQRSAILDYEETPAPISSISAISVPAIPGEYVVQPPSYNEVVHSPDDKPPSYEQVICLSNRNT